MSRVLLVAGGGTGGHLTPALALAQAVRQADPEVEPVLVGALRGVERHVLPGRDFRHVLLPSKPVYRRQWWRNAGWPLAAIKLSHHLGRLFDQERPVAVLGTGGYASAPVVWWAQRAGLPTALQEQNALPGLATRWLSRRARHIYLGLPEAERYLRAGPDTEVMDTGNPIVPPDFGLRVPTRERLGIDPSRPTVLVTGGSQGSLAINRVVAGWLDAGHAEGVNLLWVTGRRTHGEFAARHSPPRIQVFDFLDSLAEAYSVSDVVVGRAGAVTVAELCAWGLPSILIPLPTAAADHQTHNAEALARAGAAWLLPQAELTVDRFASRLASLVNDQEVRIEMSVAANERGRATASSDIAARLLTLCR